MEEEARETETTLDLDAAIAAGRQKFQGELDEAARETDDGAGSPPPNPEQPAGEGAAGAAAADEQGAAPDGKGEKTGETDEPTKPRFESHSQAEDGYRHLQGEKTRVETERNTLSTENTALKARLGEKEAAEQSGKDWSAYTAAYAEAAKKANTGALTAINELDEEAEDYSDRVAEIWTQKDLDIIGWQGAHPAPAPAPATDEAAPDAGAAPEGGADGAGEAGEAGEAEAGREATGTGAETPISEEAAMAHIEKALPAADIPLDDEYFWTKAAAAPRTAEDGHVLTFEERTQWAIDQTKNYHTRFTERVAEANRAAAQKRADEHQAGSMAMGRGTPGGGGGGAPPGKPKKVTLDDAVTRAQEESRI